MLYCIYLPSFLAVLPFLSFVSLKYSTVLLMILYSLRYSAACIWDDRVLGTFLFGFHNDPPCMHQPPQYGTIIYTNPDPSRIIIIDHSFRFKFLCIKLNDTSVILVPLTVLKKYNNNNNNNDCCLEYRFCCCFCC